MKRPCALISLTLIFALMLSLSATAHANESISDYDSPKASRENSFSERYTVQLTHDA